MSIAESQNAADEWLPLAKHCPEWCVGDHAAALVEGCGWESSREHHGRLYEGFLYDLTNPWRLERRGGLAHWYARLLQRPLPNGGSASPPLVHLEVRDPDQRLAELELTTGEARVLAAQLTRLADTVDLA